MRRLGWVAVFLVACGLGWVGGARADADPASDVLFTQTVFLPLSVQVSPPVARRLLAATGAAKRAGDEIRVAVIASPLDLGGVPALFGKPTDYARFLGAELQFVYDGRLLIVMPQGAALSQRGRLVANADVVHAVIQPGADGLIRSAIGLVETLTGATARSARPSLPVTVQESGGVTSVRVPGTNGSRGFPLWASAVIAVGAVCALLIVGFSIVRRRLRARDLEATWARTGSDPRDSGGERRP